MIKKLLAIFLSLFAALAFAAVDVNKATSAELDAVKGIGPAIAGKITAERAKGNFKDWADFISRVNGVGDKSAAKLSEAGLTVNGSSFSGAPAKPAAAPAKAEAKKDAAPAAAAAPAAKADAKPAEMSAADKKAAAAKEKADKKAAADKDKADKKAAKAAAADEAKKAKADKAAAKAAKPAASAASAAKK